MKQLIMLLAVFWIAACAGTENDSDNPDTNGDSDADGDSDSDADSDILPGDACAVSSERIRITELDVGQTVVFNEDEAGLMPMAISPLPNGGSRLAWTGDDGNVHITTLDSADQIVNNTISIPAHDFGDLYATADGGVIVLSRDADGGGTLNCGNPQNLCFPPTDDVPCYNMFMVGFNESGETWATPLTEATPTLPPYSNAPDGDTVTMIWWYAHHARIASDGINFAAYYGVAISVAEPDCINIHQGDRMNVIGPDGSELDGGFGLGCSHSGYERIVWDDQNNRYVTVCINDLPTDGENGKLALAPAAQTIMPVDLYYANVGDVVPDGNGAFWVAISDRADGEPESSDGAADVHLIRFNDSGVIDDINISMDQPLNSRAPHLSAFGENGLLVAWEQSSNPGNLSSWDAERTLYVQAFMKDTGAAIGDPLVIDGVLGNRYVSFRAFPDGSVAVPVGGESNTSVRIMRILPCS